MDEAQELRRQVLLKRDSLEPELRSDLSSRIRTRLASTDFFKRADTILLYISFRSEVETLDLMDDAISMGKQVFAPVTLVEEHRLEIYQLASRTELVPGAYGIAEPDTDKCPKGDPSSLDLVIVPRSVFSLSCGRYGYGGGFYDRFLSTRAPQAVRAGLAFDFQVMDSIPLAPHDELMDYIVTDRRTITCSRKGRER
jgi:5-formyltetrahydrofolate cyclo-ligase